MNSPATFDASGVHNIVRNFFYDEGETTRWVLDTDFQFSGYMRVMSFFMGSKHLPQTDAENDGSIQAIR